MIAIQFLAMLTMLIDHIGAVWFPDDPIWRIIGRFALPFYVYAIVIGYFRTRDATKYLTRLGLLAVISQIPYMLAFHVTELNVVATLFFCLLTFILLDRFSTKPAVGFAITAAMLVLLEAIPFDYGAYALLLALIFRYAQPQLYVVLHLILNIASVFYKGWVLQLFSLLATIWIVYLPDLMRSMDRVRVPRFIWRSFYPLHLALIALVHYVWIPPAGP
ncbi:conjugal transfer protein TraX [Paenibacillus soyae]|uniref:Conjugal transfer protein TraX n=1 Tax=Paenibacillus soyae TaxID=2969249 RepID=A0A9X2SAY4_9BACL|nr:conjugal transfer protein TraX [Paenibacillus soyae]